MKFQFVFHPTFGVNATLALRFVDVSCQHAKTVEMYLSCKEYCTHL